MGLPLSAFSASSPRVLPGIRSFEWDEQVLWALPLHGHLCCRAYYAGPGDVGFLTYRFFAISRWAGGWDRAPRSVLAFPSILVLSHRVRLAMVIVVVTGL